MMAAQGVRVTTPADLAGAPRHELLAALTAHEGLLTDNRHGIGRPVPPAQVRRAALDALATAAALAAAAVQWSWTAQLEALQHGATLDEVSAASGRSPGEVVSGLRQRIRWQVDRALMQRAVGDELLAVVDRAERARRGAR